MSKRPQNDTQPSGVAGEGQKENMTLEKFKEEFENLLMAKYGTTIGDCTDDEQIEVEFKSGSTPQDFVDWIGEKYDLTPIKEFY